MNRGGRVSDRAGRSNRSIGRHEEARELKGAGVGGGSKLMRWPPDEPGNFMQ